MQNELALHSKKEIEDYFANIWQTMRACIDRGMQMDIDDGIALENELFAMCFATEDQKEGMGAFLEKRKEKHFQNK